MGSMKEYLATVIFDKSGKKYVYKTHMTDLVPGDLIIVDTINGLTSAVFVEYIPSTTIQLLKWIIAKVEPETWDARRAQRDTNS